MKTYEVSVKKMIIATVLLLIVPFIPGLVIGHSIGFDSGWNNCLRQVMQVKTSEQFDKLSPDVKAALNRMEKVKISTTSIAGVGYDGSSSDLKVSQRE